jgi:signal transduction histidine kinase
MMSQPEKEDEAPRKVVHVWVTDTGIGISEEDQKALFGKFFRTEAGKNMATGTGLGLNITKNLVELHGGTIWVESEVGKGTTFHYTVPVVVEGA